MNLMTDRDFCNQAQQLIQEIELPELYPMQPIMFNLGKIDIIIHVEVSNKGA